MKKLILSLVVLVGFSATVHGQDLWTWSATATDDYNEVIHHLKTTYYKPEVIKDLQEAELVLSNEERDALLHKLFETIDNRWTKYYTPAEVWSYDSSKLGAGVTAMRKADGSFVVELISFQYPADRAGLRVGDRLESISGKSLKGLSLDQVHKLLSGKAGEKAEVVFVAADTGKQCKTSIVFGHVPEPVVTKLLPGHIAYFHIRDFNTNNLPDIFALKAWELHQIADGEWHGMILDLRGNHGGYMTYCYQLLSAFIETGCVGKWNNRDGNQDATATPYIVNSLKKREGSNELARALYTQPMVVLINESTMSAAEATTAGLIDRQRATVIGVKTWGKGVHFNTYQLNSGGSMTVVGGQFFGPKGGDHHGVGLKPAKEVRNTRGTRDNQLLAAREQLLPQTKPVTDAPAPQAVEEVELWKVVLVVAGSVLSVLTIVILIARRQRRQQQAMWLMNNVRFVPWTDDMVPPARRSTLPATGDGLLQASSGVGLMSEPTLPIQLLNAPHFDDEVVGETDRLQKVRTLEMPANHFFNGAGCYCCGQVMHAGETVTEVLAGNDSNFCCSNCSESIEE